MRDGKGRFIPGESGNPGGRPQSTVRDQATGEEISLRELARQYTPQAIETLLEATKHASRWSDRIAAASELLDRGWGKSAQIAVEARVKEGTWGWEELLRQVRAAGPPDAKRKSRESL